MRYIKFEDGVQWKGYLQVHETIRGFSCYVCSEEAGEKLLITRDRAENLGLSLPITYKHITFGTKAGAEAMMARIAKLNGFSKMEDNI